MLSKRIEANLEPSPLFEFMSRALANAYHEVDNPNGIISLGIAENTLMGRELAEFLTTNMKIRPCLFGYGGSCPGPAALTDGILNFYNGETFRPAVPVTKEHVYMTSGCTALLDQFFWTLCNEGEGVLVARPSYGGFISDMTGRCKLKPIHVSLNGLDPFSVEAVRRYEEELAAAEALGIKVRVLILCTPHNPLGQYARKFSH
jgi:1-aminocyclopropane-1-carboxylate synthase